LKQKIKLESLINKEYLTRIIKIHFDKRLQCGVLNKFETEFLKFIGIVNARANANNRKTIMLKDF